MPLTLANRITIFRLLLVPLFILFIFYYHQSGRQGAFIEWYRMIALIIFVTATFLDGLDGHIARSRKQITQLGTILDPLADKALLLSAIILLGRPSVSAIDPKIPTWFMVLVISRDAVLVIGAFIVNHLTGTVTVKPRWTGKVAAFCQMVVIAWVLIKLPGQPFIWLAAIAGLFTAISAIQYILDGVAQLEIENNGADV